MWRTHVYAVQRNALCTLLAFAVPSATHIYLPGPSRDYLSLSLMRSTVSKRLLRLSIKDMWMWTGGDGPTCLSMHIMDNFAMIPLPQAILSLPTGGLPGVNCCSTASSTATLQTVWPDEVYSHRVHRPLDAVSRTRFSVAMLQYFHFKDV